MVEAAAGRLGLLWSLVEWVDREGLVLVGWCVQSRRGWIPRGIWWSGGGDGTNPLEIRVGLIWQELDYIYRNRIVVGPSDRNQMIVNNIARESK